MRMRWVTGLFVAALAIVFSSPVESVAGNGDCSQPVSIGSGPSATDCLKILSVAVGVTTCAPHDECVCAPKGGLPVTATDSLVCLNRAVGASVVLNCPCDPTTTTTSTTTTSSTTTTTIVVSTTTTTTTLPSGGCTVDADCDDGEACNGFERCNGGGNCVSGSPLPCNPGDTVVVVPYLQTPNPAGDIFEAVPAVTKVDAYLLLDRANSMSDELDAIETGIVDALRAATCFPIGTAFPPDCVADLWTGIGWTGYGGTAGEAYRHRKDPHPDPLRIEANLPGGEPNGCCARTTLLGLWSTATGLGNLNVGCNVGSTYGIRPTCLGSPAGEDGVGYPCFRNDALRATILVTDEQPSTGHSCPTLSKASNDSASERIRIVTVYGSGASAAAQMEFASMANTTSAIDINNGNAPLVFDGGGTGVNAAITNAIVTMAKGVRFTEITPTATDDASDAVDATVFIDTLETAQLGTAACSDGQFERDTNFDGSADAYLAVPANTPLCWRVVPAMNNSVPATGQAQMFKVDVSIDDGSIVGIDTGEITFVVPPAN
jgi:hypothetical protein